MMTVLNFKEERNDRSRIGQDWGLAIESFLNHCKAKGLRGRTVTWYDEVLNRYFKDGFLAQIKIKSPQAFRRDDIDRLIVYAHKRGITANTANVWLRAVRTFFNYLYDGEYIEKQIKVELVKTDKTIIKTFSEAQVKLLIEKPKNANEVSFAVFRDWAIVNFLIGTGVRLGTLVAINIGDVDFVYRQILLCHTKGREQYYIPLSVSLAKVLNEYLKIRQGSQDDPLFCNTYGDRISDSTVHNRIKDYCRDRLGEVTGMRMSPHDFRHSFAIFFLRNGGNILSLQKILGHKSLEMTRRYCNLLDSDVRTKFAISSPLDNIAAAKGSGRKAIKMQR